VSSFSWKWFVGVLVLQVSLLVALAFTGFGYESEPTRTFTTVTYLLLPAAGLDWWLNQHGFVPAGWTGAVFLVSIGINVFFWAFLFGFGVPAIIRILRRNKSTTVS
jgi:hypothetical protein